MSSGYLSGDPPRAHFGLPPGEHPLALSVTWPDGATSTTDGLSPATLITLQRPAH